MAKSDLAKRARPAHTETALSASPEAVPCPLSGANGREVQVLQASQPLGGEAGVRDMRFFSSLAAWQLARKKIRAKSATSSRWAMG